MFKCTYQRGSSFQSRIYEKNRNVPFPKHFTEFYIRLISQINKSTTTLTSSEQMWDNGERRKLRNQRATVQPESRWFICLPTRESKFSRLKEKRNESAGMESVTTPPRQLSWRFGNFSTDRRTSLRLCREFQDDISILPSLRFFAVEFPLGMARLGAL